MKRNNIDVSKIKELYHECREGVVFTVFKVKRNEQIFPISKERFTRNQASDAICIIQKNIMQLENYFEAAEPVQQMRDFRRKLVDYVLHGYVFTDDEFAILNKMVNPNLIRLRFSWSKLRLVLVVSTS